VALVEIRLDLAHLGTVHVLLFLFRKRLLGRGLLAALEDFNLLSVVGAGVDVVDLVHLLGLHAVVLVHYVLNFLELLGIGHVDEAVFLG